MVKVTGVSYFGFYGIFQLGLKGVSLMLNRESILSSASILLSPSGLEEIGSGSTAAGTSAATFYVIAAIDFPKVVNYRGVSIGYFLLLNLC